MEATQFSVSSSLFLREAGVYSVLCLLVPDLVRPITMGEKSWSLTLLGFKKKHLVLVLASCSLPFWALWCVDLGQPTTLPFLVLFSAVQGEKQCGQAHGLRQRQGDHLFCKSPVTVKDKTGSYRGKVNQISTPAQGDGNLGLQSVHCTWCLLFLPPHPVPAPGWGSTVNS